MMESDTGGHLCEGLEALAPTNAHRPQTGYLGSSEDMIAKNMLGGFRDPDKSVVFHREDDDSAGL